MPPSAAGATSCGWVPAGTSYVSTEKVSSRGGDAVGSTLALAAALGWRVALCDAVGIGAALLGVASADEHATSPAAKMSNAEAERIMTSSIRGASR
jgi:hypothetical protein